MPTMMKITIMIKIFQIKIKAYYDQNYYVKISKITLIKFFKKFKASFDEIFFKKFKDVGRNYSLTLHFFIDFNCIFVFFS